MAFGEQRKKLGWVLLAAAVAAGALASVMWASASASDSEATRRLDVMDHYEARWEVEAALMEITAARLIVDAGFDPVDPTLMDDATERFVTARTRLDDLAAVDVADARVAAAAVGGDELDVPADADLFALWDAAYFVRSPALSDEPANRVEALYELSFIGTLPYHIVVETLPLISVAEGVEATGSSAEFVPEVADLVRDDESWIAENSDPLLSESAWFSVEAARAEFPDALARIEARYGDDPLLAFDAWSNDQTAPVPQLDPAAALAAATDLSADVWVIVDELVEAEINDDRAAAESAAADNDRSVVIAWLLTGAATMAFIAGLVLLMSEARRSRRLAKLATTDALTGVGTRHELEHRTRRLVADRARTHHAVAIIDLDRFKMVNDLYGHAAGDAVLVAVGSSLQELIDELAVGGVEGTVVRLGGDEFLVSLHGQGPLDEAALRAGLDRMRSSSVRCGDSELSLQFSVGVASGDADADLSDLMGAADLRVYEDKAQRAAARQRAAQPDGVTVGEPA